MAEQALSPTPSGPFYEGAVPTAWRVLGDYAGRLKVGIALRFLQAMFGGIPVALLVWVVDQLREDSLTTSEVWLVTIATLIAIAAQYVTWYVSNYLTWTNTYYAVGKARIALLEHVQRLPLGTIRSQTTGDVTTAFSTDFETASSYISNGLPALFGAVGLPLVVVIAMLFIDPPLAAAITISLIVGVPLFYWTNREFKELALIRGDRLADSSGRMLEYVQGIAVSRAFNRTTDRLSQFGRAVASIRHINTRLTIRLLPVAVLTIGVIQLGTPLAVGVITYRWFGGAIDAGTALIFLVLVLRVYGPIVALAPHIELLRLGDAALERIGRVMDLEEQATSETPTVEPQGHAVELEHVTFAYDSATVLHDVSFTARAGETTAIVGPSGAGKSTILNLVARFWDPNEGAVKIGGVDIRELTSEQLFEHITFVFQDVYLFRASVRENIAFGRPDATDAEIEAAARAAQAHDFIEALPLGYETLVGEGGATLSGGERQRLSIARAMLKDAPIVLLDEPTSSLDALNERAVRVALQALVRDKTVLVVAHRLPTIRSADQILVIEEGVIAQAGTHDELIDQEGGRYQRLWLDRERASSWRIGAAPAVAGSTAGSAEEGTE